MVYRRTLGSVCLCNYVSGNTVLCFGPKDSVVEPPSNIVFSQCLVSVCNFMETTKSSLICAQLKKKKKSSKISVNCDSFDLSDPISWEFQISNIAVFHLEGRCYWTEIVTSAWVRKRGRNLAVLGLLRKMSLFKNQRIAYFQIVRLCLQPWQKYSSSSFVLSQSFEWIFCQIMETWKIKQTKLVSFFMDKET